MNTFTYFGLTLLSILIQFTFMELIHENIEYKEIPKNVNLNVSHKRKLKDVMEDLNKKPHALYYRAYDSLKNKMISSSTPVYDNTSLPKTLFETTTDIPTTIVDELYDDNGSVLATTDETYTDADIDNVTEISLFDKKNQTVTKPDIKTKRTNTKDCSCNLLFKACDINCCCDDDCSSEDVKMFDNCKGTADSGTTKQDEYACYPRLPNMYWQRENTFGNNLFCIVKNNLPEHRDRNREKYDAAAVDKSHKWHRAVQQRIPPQFKRSSYTYGDHVWILKNGTIRYIDLPVPVINNYCTGRKPLHFLQNEKVTCTVKLKDLEMLQILKASDDATLVSVAGTPFNSSDLNCSTLFCTNWTILMCEGARCVDYNKSVHEPSCTESHCTNIALNIDYIFYCSQSKIINATIKLYPQKVSSAMPLMIQEINIKFVITNNSPDKFIEMSGNPGYLSGLPVIVSYSPTNHTENFFNSTSTRKYMAYPDNKNGFCAMSNATHNFVIFQSNKRLKCRFQYVQHFQQFNETDICHKIYETIKELLQLNDKIFVAPFGNPQNVKDDEWLPLQGDMRGEPVYGEYNDRQTKLHCYNMVTGKSLIFTFAGLGDKTKNIRILNAKSELHVQNVTFNVEDISTVLTIDTMFIDQTKPSVYEYAAGPHLDIHLPKDFFFPFHQYNSNNCNYASLIIYCCMFIIHQIK